MSWIANHGWLHDEVDPGEAEQPESPGGETHRVRRHVRSALDFETGQPVQDRNPGPLKDVHSGSISVAVSGPAHSASDLEQIYQRRFAGSENYRIAVWRVLVDEVFSKWITADSSILDLGSGFCEFINQIPARRKYAMDLNPATKSHAARDVAVLLQDCSAEWQVPPSTLNTVFSSNFFEHLPDKGALERTVQNAFHCLKPRGRLIALGPNIRYTGTAYWDFYDHYIALSHLSLIELLEKCGFEIEYVRAQFLPYTMAYGSRCPTWVLRAYLRLPPLWTLFGKQFLVIVRKPT